MSEKNIKIKLSGWKALAIIPLFAAIFVFRIAAMNNKKNNKNLMKEIEFQMMTEYFPDDVNRMKSLYESDNNEKFNEVVKSVISTKLTIKSVKASYPIFDFFHKYKDVIVKVNYSLDDAYGTREQGTKYYSFEHSPMINRWRYKSKRSKLSYYLNFI